LTNFVEIDAIDNDFSLTDDQWIPIQRNLFLFTRVFF